MSVEVTVEFPEMDAIKAAFRNLSPSLAAKYMGSALNKTIEPAYRMLITLTPRGPTGNLKRAVRKKVKRYTGSPTSRNPAKSPGAAVALAGYTAPPRKKSEDLKSNEKGQHAGFLEFGTKPRRTSGYIASSFNRSGPVKARVAKRSGAITTSPKPPKGFVKAVPKGNTVDLGAFPIGGKAGLPPVKTAYQRSLGTMKATLPREMSIALNNALKDKFGPFGKGRSGK